MSDVTREMTDRLRNSLQCLSIAVALLPSLDDAAERAQTLALIERQADEAEIAAEALEAEAQA
jgi:hypothetical protein